jgi:hypothetical protein
MRQAATALIFGLALLIIFALYLSHSLVIVQRLAVVDRVQGRAEVLVHGRGDPSPLEEGKLVRAGDLLQTGPASSVELRWVRWAGGMRIKIGPNTLFKITRSIVNRSTHDTQSRLRVDMGRIWVRLRERLTGKSKFEVETPTVVAAVRGTVFSVAVGEDGASHVEVLEGEVAVAGRDGAATTLTAGSRTVIAPGQEGLDTYPLTPEDVAQWHEQTSMLGPFLALESPEDGVLVEEVSCTVSGRSEAGVQVLVNGGAVDTSSEGRFSVAVPLEAGVNTLVVTARDAAGRETTVVRTVPRAARVLGDAAER